jgi:hypothetical protein
MAHARKGHLVVALEWAKHLRRFGKKMYWHRHRHAEKKVVRREVVIAKERL